MIGPAILVPVLHQVLPGPSSRLATPGGVLLAIMLLTCAGTDLTTRRIPNWATYSTVLWAFVLGAADSLVSAGSLASRGWGSLGTPGLAGVVLGFAASFAMMLVVFIFAGGGAGDVKLAAAIGAFLGVRDALTSFVWAYVLAGIAVASFCLWTAGPLKLARMVGWKILARFTGFEDPYRAEGAALARTPIPLAPFFAAGVIGTLGMVPAGGPW